MVGSLAVLQWRLKPDFFRAILLTTNTLANISFLVSLLISILGLTELIEEDRAKKATAYAFIAGIACLIGSIALFSWIVVSKLPWSAYD